MFIAAPRLICRMHTSRRLKAGKLGRWQDPVGPRCTGSRQSSCQTYKPIRCSRTIVNGRRQMGSGPAGHLRSSAGMEMFSPVSLCNTANRETRNHGNPSLLSESLKSRSRTGRPKRLCATAQRGTPRYSTEHLSLRRWHGRPTAYSFRQLRRSKSYLAARVKRWSEGLLSTWNCIRTPMRER